MVLNDYLPQIVGQEAVDKALKTPVNKGFFQPGEGDPLHPGGVLGGGVPVRPLPDPQRVQHQ